MAIGIRRAALLAGWAGAVALAGAGAVDRGSAPVARVPVAVTGLRDVFFVSRNDTATPSAALMVATAIRFAVR